MRDNLHYHMTQAPPSLDGHITLSRAKKLQRAQAKLVTMKMAKALASEERKAWVNKAHVTLVSNTSY